MTKAEQRREAAAQQALDDIRFLIESTNAAKPAVGVNDLTSEQLLALLRRNFDRLDPDNNGLSRSELATALMQPGDFSSDEYVMLQLIAKYFDTIANMSDDEAGQETRITRLDCDVLMQFLLNSQLTIAQLHKWCSVGNEHSATNLTPPPLTSG